MRFCYPDISGYFEIDGDRINTIIIENKVLFRKLITDIYDQTNGENGKTIIEENAKLLDISKNVELLSSFIPFDMNRKNLVSKIIASLERTAIDEYHFEQTTKILSEIELYLDTLTDNYNCNISCDRLTVLSLIKAAGVEIIDDYTSLAEKIIDYMELVREFERDKLFFTVNLRSYIDDEETERFLKTVLNHHFKLVMIENTEYNMLECESRRIIDDDLCEF